jgi:ankyrin repeat protein
MTEQTYYALKYPLHVAAARGELMDTKTILESKAHHVNVKDMEGWTALHWAAKRGQMSVVDHLLKSGADVHAKSTGTQFGKTALHLASGDAHMHVIQKLLDAGAEITGSWTYNEAKNLGRF